MTNQTPERQRISVEVSPVVAGQLDYVSEVLGVTKSGILLNTLLQSLPDLVARADVLRKRHNELVQAKKK